MKGKNKKKEKVISCKHRSFFQTGVRQGNENIFIN